MSDPAELSLAEAAKAIRHRALSSVELVRACLARIERWQPRINAFIAIEAEEALAAACAADAASVRGPLHGVPFAHKDMFYRAGRVCTCGAKIRRDWKAGTTATVLARLERAGAITLGTLNMAEFAYGPTGHNEHFGHCRNPWHPDYITGGSSSGSGAAVAARLVFGALGSDTGGSVRAPAGICGVTGLKPTWGRVSRAGVMPLSHSLDTVGPIARSAEDCALLLAAIAGRDPADPQSSAEPTFDYAAARDAPVRGMRIALPQALLDAEAHAEVAQATREAARAWREIGVAIREVPAPDLDGLSALCLIVMQAEVSTLHRRWMRERQGDYSSQVRARLEAGYAIPAVAYLEALRARAGELDRFCRDTLAGCDALLLPVMAIRTPTLAETDVGGGPAMAKTLGEVTRFLRWVNFLGVPALALPAGFDSRGLPVGVQLVGRPFAEDTLLRLGRALQQATDWHRRAPACGGVAGSS